jgi:hypothetical protein
VARPVIPAEQRFFEKVKKDKKTGCWLWTAGLMSTGYPQFRWGIGKNGYGHRWAYEHFVGPIPEGRQLHHTCGTPICVNPEHLVPTEPGNHRTEHHLRTHCKRGHLLDGDNLYVNPGGTRTCRTCMRMHHKNWRDRNQEHNREWHRDYQRRVRADAKKWREAQASS